MTQRHAFPNHRPSFLPAVITAAALGAACTPLDPGASTMGSSESTGVEPPGTTGDESTSSSGSVDSSTGVGSTDTGSTSGTSGTSEGSTGSSSEGSSGGSSGEESGSSSGGEVVEAPPWMVSLDLVAGATHLIQVDIDTAATLDFCTVINTNNGQPFSSYAYSATFTRDDRLVFSTGNQLWEIELPTCEAAPIGPIGFSQVYGIAPDEGNDLFGLDAATDVLLRIDATTGVGTEVGGLGSNWSTLGVTWDEAAQQILGVNGNTDELNDIDPATGMASVLQALGIDVFQVAFEYHSRTELSYVCSDDSQLLRIEADGSLTDLGNLGLNLGCLNLAAPWSDAAGLPPLP